MRFPRSGGRACVPVLLLAALTSCDGGTEVETPRAASIAVSPITLTLSFIGATQPLTATVKDQNGAAFAGAVTWSSDSPAVVSVSATGVVTAVSKGATTIRAVSGSATATASVVVQQVAATLWTVAGNAQEAFAGTALAEPVVVRVVDQGGSAVEGVTVTFTPEHGVVSTGSADSDANGEVSTTWTLGEPLGPQALVASVAGGVSATITATSRSLGPIPDLTAAGSMTVGRTDPSSLEAVEVQVTVRNDGNGDTAHGIHTQLLLDGAEIATAELSALAAGALDTVTFTVGPFAVGARELRFNVDPDNAIEESDESNNGVSRTLTVVLQTPLDIGTPLTGLAGTISAELLFRLDLPVGSASNLTVELSGPLNQDVDLYIERGERPSFRTQYDDCVSTSQTTIERCQISPAPLGSYHILLHAFTTFSGVTMTITLDGEVLPYDIELVFLDNGTEAQDAAVRMAAERWESIIPLDLPDADFSASPYAAGACITGQPLIDDNVDDLRIYVSIVEIDGGSGVLADAGPCVTRGGTGFPIVGQMKLDAADLGRLEADGDMLAVVVHEMGHILGLGTIWDNGDPHDLLVNPSVPSSAGVDTHFTGAHAIAAFDAAGGSGYTLGAKVPVANRGIEGSSDAHWREVILDNELMTPLFNTGRVNPLSAISIQALADLGYNVDVSKADSYSKEFSSPSRAPEIARPVLDLSGDVRRGPVVVVDSKGRVIRVR